MQEMKEAGPEDLPLAPTPCLCQNVTFLLVTKRGIQSQNSCFIRFSSNQVSAGIY